MKEWLKSVMNYQSYPQIKLGICFLDHPVYLVECVPFSSRVMVRI